MSGFVLHIVVSTNLSLFSAASFFAYGSDLVVAVVVVDPPLDVECDGGDLGGESWDTHLGVDGGVGVAAVHLGGVAVAGVGLGGHQSRSQEGQQILKRKMGKISTI